MKNNNQIIGVSEADLGDDMSLTELLSLYVSKWRWFAISVVICLMIATFYILITPPVYTRYASVLVKDDAKGSSMSTEVENTFSDMGIFQTKSNVHNEMMCFQSPNVMYEVVKRLHLDLSYKMTGAFYDETLYGVTLPVVVSFDDLDETQSASLTMVPEDKSKVTLTGFVKNGERILADDVEVMIGGTVQTPLGRVSVRWNGDNVEHRGLSESIDVSKGNLKTVADAYQKRLEVTLATKEATVINLTMKDVNTQRAEDVINTVISVYNEIWIKDKNQISLSTNDFINERLQVIESELGNVDNTISDYKSSNMVPDLIATATRDMQQSTEAEKHIINLNNQISISRFLLGYVREMEMRLLPGNAGLTESEIEKQISGFNELLLQRNRLAGNSSERNLIVKDLDEQMKQMKSAIESSIENYIEGLRMQLRSAEKVRGDADARISANPKQAGRLLSDERQQKVKEALYLFLLQKREENELSQAFTAYNIRVVTTPSHGGNMAPTAPVKKMVFLVAIALGVVIPMALLFLIASMNTKVRGKRDIEGLSVPYVGEIPYAYKRKHGWRKLASRICGGSYNVVKSRDIMVMSDKKDVINEAFRVVRTNLEFILRNRATCHVIMITSANPGSGKTFVTENIASSFVVKGKRVIVLDLDLRKNTLSELVDKKNMGVSNYIAGQVEDIDDLIVRNVRGSGLDLMPVGVIPPNPTELLAESRLDQLLEALKTKYDYIFLDCPPIEIVSDADVISRLADTTIFIIRTGLLERSMLPDVEKIYKSGRFHNMLLLLNGTDETGMYGYGYGYRYAYGYGYRYAYGHERK